VAGRQTFRLLMVGKSDSGKSALARQVIRSMEGRYRHLIIVNRKQEFTELGEGLRTLAWRPGTLVAPGPAAGRGGSRGALPGQTAGQAWKLVRRAARLQRRPRGLTARPTKQRLRRQDHPPGQWVY
jgi:GTPase SAR1 family protein